MTVKKKLFVFQGEGSEDQMVKLFALTPSGKYLEWVNPYSESKVPKIFMQKTNQHGTKMYDVNLPYAQRLISGQPHKYFLAYPDVIQVKFGTKGGGSEIRNIHRVTEKLDKDGKVVIDPDKKRNPHGYPKLVNPGEADEDTTEIDNKDPLE